MSTSSPRVMNGAPVVKLPNQGPVESKFPLYLVLFSLLLEFGRPQDMAGLKGIPIPSIVDGLIAIMVLVFSGKLNFENKQTKLWIALLGLMALHVPFATNNFWALMTFKDMVLLFCVYIGVITYINTLERVRTLSTVWLAVHLVPLCSAL